jgi:hypothetical protein
MYEDMYQRPSRGFFASVGRHGAKPDLSRGGYESAMKALAGWHQLTKTSNSIRRKLLKMTKDGGIKVVCLVPKRLASSRT